VCQCVASLADLGAERFAAADHMGQETSLEVTGIVRENKRAPGGFELTMKSLEVVSPATDYPITNKEHGVAFLLDNRHLWIRSSRQHAILRVRSEVASACRDFFYERGFALFDAPILTPTSCEGTTNLFELDYFGERKAYLTQSGQLYAEAGALAFGKVYCFGPTFRAEKSKTRRHLTEFWMVEPEVAYCDLAGDMELAEQFVSYIVSRVLQRRSAELKALERDTTKLQSAAQLPYPRISYDEAIERLKKKGVAVNWGDDFGGDEETALSEEFDRPVMVHRYPTACKAFYMKQDPARPDVALCVDMLAPEGHGEIIGGGQREDDYETLRTKIMSHGLPLAPFEWYLDLRRYGTVPHAGFGMGIERMTGWLCGIHHIRETVPFPRMMERLEP
ncbi:asparagine--tRNA ligase, partial [Candidatus Binatus sp.]|uniref:asparagine--tRNA ligase n=1 Tax=Candidatus Binatus sp. TaxID=2811406 RepID=UPI003CB71C3F